MKKTIFREYDIRGVYPREISIRTISDIARAFYFYVYRKRRQRFQFLVGYDCRLSSPELATAVVRALQTLGADVLFCGMVPTPAIYWGLNKISLPVAGLMITASHNPKEFNGLKLNIGNASIFGSQIQEIYTLTKKLPALGKKYLRKSPGQVKEYPLLDEYKNYLIKSFSCLKNYALPENKLAIGLDFGNGTAGLVLPDVLTSLGLKFYSLYSEPDGNFPNHHPDPTVEKNLLALWRLIRKFHLQVGLAFDGDADRLGVLDERGRIIYGDQLLYIFARSILKKNPGTKIISEVKCSAAVLKAIEKLGGKAIMGPTGHSRIKDLLRREKAVLAGEMSGHFFFADRADAFGYDDALYSSLRLLEIMLTEKVGLATTRKEIKSTAISPEIRLFLPDEKKFATITNLKQIARKRYPFARIVTIDGLRIEFADGWFLVRASNTQPALILRAEAENQRLLDKYLTELKFLLQDVGVNGK